MSDYEMFRCERHGFDVPILRPSEAEERGLPVGCTECVRELEARPAPEAMSGDERAAEVTTLLTDPNTAGMQRIWDRVAALVGREVWTHELVNPGVLAEEARDWKHPDDLMGHVVGTLRDAMGDKPLIVIGEPLP